MSQIEGELKFRRNDNIADALKNEIYKPAITKNRWFAKHKFDFASDKIMIHFISLSFFSPKI